MSKTTTLFLCVMFSRVFALCASIIIELSIHNRPSKQAGKADTDDTDQRPDTSHEIQG